MEDIVYREQNSGSMREKIMGVFRLRGASNGQVTVDVEYGSQRKEPSLLIVVGEQRPPLLGYDWLHSSYKVRLG